MEQSRSPIVKFLRVVWGFLKAYFIGVGLLFTVGPILVAFFVGNMGKSEFKSSTKTNICQTQDCYIELNINGNITSGGSDFENWFIFELFSDRETVSIPDIKRALEAGSKDLNLKGVFISVYNIGADKMALIELRRLIQTFRKDSGKPVHMSFASINNQALMLSTAADRVTLMPTGDVSIPGPVLSLTYLGPALEKIGVEFEVFQAGQYKSAMEPLIRSEPSPENLLVLKTLESKLRSHITQEIAKAKNVQPEVVAGWMQQGFMIPKDAVDAGIIASVENLAEARNTFKVAVFAEEGAGTANDVSIADYIADIETPEPEGEDGIGLIVARGDIVMGADGDTNNFIEPDLLSKKLRWMAENDDVKAVLFQIDSGGGSATASEIIWHEVKLLAQKKPVIVSMQNVAASGGYYIAAPATEIFAEPSTITGSIGVIGAIPNLRAFKEKYGVYFHTVTQTDRANIFNPGERLTSFDRAAINAGVREVYMTFLSRVAEGRKMTIDQVDQLAQGRVYTGVEALELGLIDNFGGFYDAIARAKELGGLDPEKLYRLHRYKSSRLNIRDCIKSPMKMIQCMDELDSSTSVVHPVLDIAVQAQRIAKLAEQDKWLALMPSMTIR